MGVLDEQAIGRTGRSVRQRSMLIWVIGLFVLILLGLGGADFSWALQKYPILPALLFIVTCYSALTGIIYCIENRSILEQEMGQFAASSSWERRVCDYIASMTDRYAQNMYQRLFLPRSVV